MDPTSSSEKEDSTLNIYEDNYETVCWGCGLRLLLPSYAPIFKCGWCGAITNNMPKQYRTYWFDKFSAARDRFFVVVVLVVVFSLICGGIWAVYPVVFEDTGFTSIFHCILTLIFSTGTLVNYILAAFRPAGKPPVIRWGHYSVVSKGSLNDYSFCHFCSKPKSKQTHHCSTCKSCVLDMDHHCPFIGNCVGAENHHHFINFLFFALVSNIYILVMSTYSILWIWPSLVDIPERIEDPLIFRVASSTVRGFIYGIMNSPILLSARAISLLYLIMASIAIGIGIAFLFYQQVHLLYHGQTYIESLKGETSDGLRPRSGWGNLYRIFRSEHPIYWLLPKISKGSLCKKSHKK